MHDETVVVTGAFSYTGKYTTQLLLNQGYKVRTLTNHSGTQICLATKWKYFLTLSIAQNG
jgi:nucleoside-diphosphate-sugar epimerase